jgi:hypothetical protein
VDVARTLLEERDPKPPCAVHAYSIGTAVIRTTAFASKNDLLVGHCSGATYLQSGLAEMLLGEPIVS